MTQNCFHRRNRRRDSPSDQVSAPRYMWRFMCYRTTEPNPAHTEAVPSEQLVDGLLAGGSDALTGSEYAPSVGLAMWPLLLTYRPPPTPTHTHTPTRTFPSLASQSGMIDCIGRRGRATSLGQRAELDPRPPASPPAGRARGAGR